MTKEPIMIDDVDVSECECYNSNIKMDCILYPLQPDACKNNPNCYYKQLKRKEQECFDLLTRANAYNSLVIIANDRLDRIEVKEKEIQELKEKYKWYDHYKESALRNKELYNDLSIKFDQLESKNKNYEKGLEELYNFNKKIIDEKFKIDCQKGKLKQALQEIKNKLNESMGAESFEKHFKCIEEALKLCEVIKE